VLHLKKSLARFIKNPFHQGFSHRDGDYKLLLLQLYYSHSAVVLQLYQSYITCYVTVILHAILQLYCSYITYTTKYITGIGVSSTYMASSTILTAYFQRFSYFAFSLAILGTFIGSTVWPIGSQYLLDTFGYSKAMGFMAISHLIHFIAGASFIPPNNTQQSSEGTRLLK